MRQSGSGGVLLPLLLSLLPLLECGGSRVLFPAAGLARVALGQLMPRWLHSRVSSTCLWSCSRPWYSLTPGFWQDSSYEG